MKKDFTAYADTGRDFITFEFSSDHRAGSKANIADAQAEYKRLHGHKVKVTKTILID